MPFLSSIKKTILIACPMATLLLFLVFYNIISTTPPCYVLPASSTRNTTNCIIIDAGHGGIDPGKIGVNNSLEKDINLSIALKLKPLLEKEGFTVILTREDDTMLSSKNSSSPKRDDMIARAELIEKHMPYITISIHQNSFTDASITGPQVFYYENSTDGEYLASCLQSSLNTELLPIHPRTIQANDSYFLLKETPTPTVIVECGFLSNFYEANLLCDSNYQLKIAEAICHGILAYQKEPVLNN